MSDGMGEDKARELVRVIAEAIREVGEVPSGHLYNVPQGYMGLGTYQMIIDKLEQAGLIKVRFHLITWTGPVDGPAVEVRVKAPEVN